jgi:hypothetical protein
MFPPFVSLKRLRLLESTLTAKGKLLRGKSVAELITPDMSTLAKCRPFLLMHGSFLSATYLWTADCPSSIRGWLNKSRDNRIQLRLSPSAFPPKGACMLRIERSGNGQVLFTLSGRIQEGEIQELQQLLISEKSGQQLIFNLRDVTLVNQDAVKFLGKWEAHGIKLENCPLHIRTWIDQVKNRPRRRQT